MNTYTWGQIQLETIKKMFLNKEILLIKNLKTMRIDNRYKTYLDSMPQACNEAISEIVKRGKPYIKTFNLTIQPIINLINFTEPIFHDGTTDITYVCDKGLSYYFEVDNLSTIKIYINNILTKTIENKKHLPGQFTIYKGFLDNNDNNEIKFVFTSSHPYYIRNLAIYGINYNPGDNNIKYIPDYCGYYKYNLKTLLPDYYNIDKLYKDNIPLKNNTDYFFEDRTTLILNEPGFYKILYECYPIWITSETSDDEEFTLDPEVAVIIPLYMASQLYKDVDNSIATQYRNEFEVALENYYDQLQDLEFTSVSEWL